MTKITRIIEKEENVKNPITMDELQKAINGTKCEKTVGVNII